MKMGKQINGMVSDIYNGYINTIINTEKEIITRIDNKDIGIDIETLERYHVQFLCDCDFSSGISIPIKRLYHIPKMIDTIHSVIIPIPEYKLIKLDSVLNTNYEFIDTLNLNKRISTKHNVFNITELYAYLKSVEGYWDLYPIISDMIDMIDKFKSSILYDILNKLYFVRDNDMDLFIIEHSGDTLWFGIRIFINISMDMYNSMLYNNDTFDTLLRYYLYLYAIDSMDLYNNNIDANEYVSFWKSIVNNHKDIPFIISKNDYNKATIYRMNKIIQNIK